MEHGQLVRPLGQPPLPQMDREDDDGHQGPSLSTVFGFLFLIFNSVMAVYRSNRDFWAMSFVVFSYLVLVLLFYCLRQLEKERPESPRRVHLKAAVWMLTIALTAVFSYNMAAIMPLPVQVLVWALAGTTALAILYAFFLHTRATALAVWHAFFLHTEPRT